MNRPILIRFVALLAALALLSGEPTGGHEHGAPTPQFRTGVDLVVFDVSVLDQRREPVRGLTANDFTVVEDGIEIPIQTFQAVGQPAADDSMTGWMREVAPDVQRNDDLGDKRILVIVLDDALAKNVLSPDRPAAIQQTRLIANRFIDNMGPRDLAAVVFPFDKSGGQNFTNDKALLRRAVARYSGNSESRLLAEPGGAVAFRDRYLAESLATTLRTVADYLGDIPNKRKALVLVSEGIPMNVAVLGSRQSLADGDESAGELRNVLREIKATIDAAQRANVSIYPFNPAGLVTTFNARVRGTDEGGAELDPIASDGDGHKHDFLSLLASDTGGFAVIDSNEERPAIAQVFRENSSYYLLGCVPPDGDREGRFRRVSVRVKRPGLIVRSRTGYFERVPSRATPSGAAASAGGLSAALASLLPRGDIAMHIAAGPLAVPGRRETAIGIVVALRLPTVSVGDRVVDDVVLVLDAYGGDGDRKARQQLNAKVALRPAMSEGAACELIGRLDLTPGRYQLRAAAQSSVQARAGSVFCDLDVPDLSSVDLGLSGVFLSARTGRAVAPKEGLGLLAPVTPTTLREFGVENEARAFVRVYQHGRRSVSNVTVEATIVDGAGTKVFEASELLTPPRFSVDGEADFWLPLPVAKLKPGAFLLTIAAIRGDRSVNRNTRFDVRQPSR
jgi:VWFA-related protein